MRRWIWIGVAAAILAAAFFGLRYRGAVRAERDLENLQTLPVTRGALSATVGATGTVRANQSAQLVFQTTGIVEDVFVALGDPVAKDAILATLESTSLPSQVLLARADLVTAEKALEDLQDYEKEKAAAQLELAQAQDALEDAIYKRNVRQQGRRASEDTINAARANLVLAEKKVEDADAAFRRVKGRPEDDPQRAAALLALANARKERDSALRNLNWYLGYPSETEQALLDAEVALAEARLEDAKREWERVKDGPDADEIAAAQARVDAARATLEMAHVRAPFSGTITAVHVMPGDRVSAGSPAFGLADLSRLLVDVELSEVDVNRVRMGQPVELTFDAVPDKVYQGEVVEIGLVGMAAQGVVNFPVTVQILDADGLVRPGMTAAVNIVAEEVEDALQIPNRAVRLRDGRRVVYVLRQGELTPVTVELGVSSETNSQVLEGDLEVGDLVVLNPPMEFEQGGGPPFFRGGQ